MQIVLLLRDLVACQVAWQSRGQSGMRAAPPGSVTTAPVVE